MATVCKVNLNRIQLKRRMRRYCTCTGLEKIFEFQLGLWASNCQILLVQGTSPKVFKLICEPKNEEIITLKTLGIKKKKTDAFPLQF